IVDFGFCVRKKLLCHLLNDPKLRYGISPAPGGLFYPAGPSLGSSRVFRGGASGRDKIADPGAM
ncbi:MAG: hypothetical protein U9N82_05545, partial [Thermodesulfobacteriota bacterium]|nr:hypothetical protein [Thermodesulfobacteriota bacterium]